MGLPKNWIREWEIGGCQHLASIDLYCDARNVGSGLSAQENSTGGNIINSAQSLDRQVGNHLLLRAFRQFLEALGRFNYSRTDPIHSYPFWTKLDCHMLSQGINACFGRSCVALESCPIVVQPSRNINNHSTLVEAMLIHVLGHEECANCVDHENCGEGIFAELLERA